MAQLFTIPRQFAIRSDGTTYPGMLAYFYRAGTLTDLAVYQDANLTTAHPQPVVADDQGMLPPIYVASNLQDYRVILRTSGLALISDTDNVPRSSATAAELGEIFYPRTTAEAAASVTPINYVYPSGNVLRYGADPTGVQDSHPAFVAAIASRGGDSPVTIPGGQYRLNSPLTLAAATGGARLIGEGRPTLRFFTFGDTVPCLLIQGANYRQSELRNLIIDANVCGTDAVQLNAGDKPIIDNVVIQNSNRAGFKIFCAGFNWVENGEFSLEVRDAGTHAVEFELTGSNGAFINECLWKQLEIRGVSRRSAGGRGIIGTSSATSPASKVSNQLFLKTNFDAIYTAGAGVPVPSTNVVEVNSGTFENFRFLSVGWENTGATSLAAGYAFAVTGSGVWVGLTVDSAITNAFWGALAVDPDVTRVWNSDFSFPSTAVVGPLSVRVEDPTKNGTVVTGLTTANAVNDFSSVRTGTAVDTILRGAGIYLGNSTESTYLQIQEHLGSFVLYTYSGGAWGERARILPNGNLVMTGTLSLPDGITAPAAVIGRTHIYVDSADGDLKVRFGDGVTKTLATDT